MSNKESKERREEKREEKKFTQKGHKKTFQNHSVKVATDSYSKNCTQQFWKVVKFITMETYYLLPNQRPSHIVTSTKNKRWWGNVQKKK